MVNLWFLYLNQVENYQNNLFVEVIITKFIIILCFGVNR